MQALSNMSILALKNEKICKRFAMQKKILDIRDGDFFFDDDDDILTQIPKYWIIIPKHWK